VLVKPNVVPAGELRAGPGTYFLVLSRLSVEKGLDELVRAWHPDLGVLRLVGDGPLRPEIERLAEGHGVRVEPPAAPAEVPSLIAGARALLLPSACYEGQPRVALEAYSAGVPVVASRLGALPELVHDGETGLTVARGDLSGWRAAVTSLATDETSLRLGRGALELWRARFSPERGLAALEDAYAAARLARSESAGRTR
jgi:glycosyltransferase involved in cell wall biosynthesis